MINCRHERFFRGNRPCNLFKCNARRIMLALTLVPDVDETSSAILTALVNRFFFTSSTTDPTLPYSTWPAPGRFVICLNFVYLKTMFFFNSIMASVENGSNFAEHFPSLLSFKSNSLRSVEVCLLYLIVI